MERWGRDREIKKERVTETKRKRGVGDKEIGDRGKRERKQKKKRDRVRWRGVSGERQGEILKNPDKNTSESNHEVGQRVEN